MTGKTHILGGLTASACLIASGMEPTTTMIGASVLGSLLPDIDHFNSSIANKNGVTKGFAAVISTMFRHRGFIHTPAFIVLVAASLMFAITRGYTWVEPLIIPLCSGMLSHLLLDSMNLGGIMWLWPLSDSRQHILNIKTGSISEYAVTILLIGITLMASWSKVLPLIEGYLLNLI